MIRLLTLIIIFSFCVYPQNAQDNNLFMMGQSFEQSGNVARAKEIYEDLYNRQKNNYQYFDALNRTYLQLKEYKASIALIEEKLKAAPNDINLLGMLGKTYHMLGDETKAFSLWDEAAEKGAGNPAIYKLISNYAIERRAFRKALEILQKGKEFSPADEMISLDLASIYSMLMEYENAAREYCSMLITNPNQYTLVEARIMTYINKPEALQQTIKAVEDHEKNSAVKNLLGRLYLEEKNFDEAYTVFLDLEDSGNKIGVELLKFAQFAYAENEFMHASKAYSEVIERYPKSPYVPNAKLGYAKTLEAGLIQQYTDNNSWKPVSFIEVKEPGKFDEVISAYKELINLYASTDVAVESNFRIGIIKYHYQNKPDEAEEFFNKVISLSPLSGFAVDSYAEIGDILLVKGNLEGSFDTFSRIVSNVRAPEEKRKFAEYRIALINFYKGEFEASKKILAGLAMNLKDNSANDAIELSLLLNTTMNDSSNLLTFARAELLKTQKNFESAAEKYRQVNSSQGGFMLQHLAKIREAEMELALNNTQNAVILFEKIAEEKEKNIYADKALYLLGKINQNALGDSGKALELYEDLLVKFPNSLYINEAREEILKIRSKSS